MELPDDPLLDIDMDYFDPDGGGGRRRWDGPIEIRSVLSCCCCRSRRRRESCCQRRTHMRVMRFFWRRTKNASHFVPLPLTAMPDPLRSRPQPTARGACLTSALVSHGHGVLIKSNNSTDGGDPPPSAGAAPTCSFPPPMIKITTKYQSKTTRRTDNDDGRYLASCWCSSPDRRALTCRA